MRTNTTRHTQTIMPAAERGTGTQSLDRAVRLLREIAARAESGARLTDLIAATGFTKGTSRRLLAAMIREKLLEQDPRTRRYFLGPETFALGTVAADRFGPLHLRRGDASRAATQSLAKYSGDAVPVAALLCDRHLGEGRGEALALIYENAAGHTSRLSYGTLAAYSRRFAGVLKSLGVGEGDRVATFLPKGPELLIASLAIWRLGAVQVPLFATFGEHAVLYRLNHSETSVVVTNGTCRARVAGGGIVQLRVVTIEGDGIGALTEEDIPFWSALHAAKPIDSVATRAGDEPFVLLYDAAVSGPPKGTPIPVKMLAILEKDMRLVLDVRDEDVFWNVADPSWAGGLFYSVLGSLLLGRAAVLCDGPFDARQFYRILGKLAVTNLFATPNWFRVLRAADIAPPSGLSLRIASSVGEVLPTDLADWAAQRLGVTLYDQYGQAELGIPIANFHAPAFDRSLPVGSIGRATPGFHALVLDPEGREVPAGASGELAFDTEKSPLFWFAGYYNDETQTAQRFRHGRRYYLTGDLVRNDTEGNFYYLGAIGDVIISEGYPIAHGELEAAIAAHTAVAEAAVVNKPDRLVGEIVKAFVVLKPEHTPSPALASALVASVKAKLSPDAYPPEIEIVPSLPRTADGKLHRVALRNGVADVGSAAGLARMPHGRNRKGHHSGSGL